MMSRRFQFSLGRLLLVVALCCAAVELGNLSLASWGPCGGAGPAIEMHTAMLGCALSYSTCVGCAIALCWPARPRTNIDLLRRVIVVLAISLVAAFAFLAKLVHDTHGSQTIIFKLPNEI